MLERSAIEGMATEAFASAGIDEECPPGPLTLARRLLGPNGIQRVGWHVIRGDAALARIGKEWRIFVRKGLHPRQLSFAVAHELAHWLCDRRGYAEADIEEVCDAIAGALVLPRIAFQNALEFLGDSELTDLAEVFVVTESSVALRIGETTGRPLCLVTPTKIRIRGDAWEWPESETKLRALAKGRPMPGLRKARLGDDPRRVLIAVEGA